MILHKLSTTASSDQNNFGLKRHRNINNRYHMKTKFTFFLNNITRLKSKLNVLSWSGVVYQISCSQCEAFYVGKTKRRLEQRVQEHSQQGYSSLYKHSSDLCHQIDYSNPAVISVDNNDYRLQIKEALKIKDLKAYNSLNANIRSCELKLW